jgi:hypothetical protein
VLNICPISCQSLFSQSVLTRTMKQSPLESDNESINNEIKEPSLESTPACDVPDPDSLQETKDLPRYPPRSEPTPKVRETTSAILPLLKPPLTSVLQGLLRRNSPHRPTSPTVCMGRQSTFRRNHRCGFALQAHPDLNRRRGKCLSDGSRSELFNYSISPQVPHECQSLVV